VSGQLQECRAGGREFRLLGDVTEKLKVPNAVRVNRTVSRFVLPLGNEQVVFDFLVLAK